MKPSIRFLASLIGLTLLSGVPCRAQSADPDAGLQEKIRILQDAFSRFERERIEFQTRLRFEDRARKAAEASLTDALARVTALQKQNAEWKRRIEESMRLTDQLETDRDASAVQTRELDRALRHLETEVERLSALTQAQSQTNRDLKDQNEKAEENLRMMKKRLEERPPASPVQNEKTGTESEPASVSKEVEGAPSSSLSSERGPIEVPQSEEENIPPKEGLFPSPGVASDLSPSLASAKNLLDRGEDAAAEVMLMKMVATRRPDVDALVLLGRLQMRQKRFSEAVETLRVAIRFAPKKTAILKDLALAYHGGGKAVEAIRYFNKVVQLDEKDGEAHFNLAALYLMLPKPDIKESAAHYEKAMRLGEPRDERLERILFR